MTGDVHKYPHYKRGRQNFNQRTKMIQCPQCGKLKSEIATEFAERWRELFKSSTHYDNVSGRHWNKHVLKCGMKDYQTERVRGTGAHKDKNVFSILKRKAEEEWKPDEDEDEDEDSDVFKRVGKRQKVAIGLPPAITKKGKEFKGGAYCNGCGISSGDFVKFWAETGGQPGSAGSVYKTHTVRCRGNYPFKDGGYQPKALEYLQRRNLLPMDTLAKVAKGYVEVVDDDDTEVEGSDSENYPKTKGDYASRRDRDLKEKDEDSAPQKIRLFQNKPGRNLIREYSVESGSKSRKKQMAFKTKATSKKRGRPLGSKNRPHKKDGTFKSHLASPKPLVEMCSKCHMETWCCPCGRPPAESTGVMASASLLAPPKMVASPEPPKPAALPEPPKPVIDLPPVPEPPKPVTPKPVPLNPIVITIPESPGPVKMHSRRLTEASITMGEIVQGPAEFVSQEAKDAKASTKLVLSLNVESEDPAEKFSITSVGALGALTSATLAKLQADEVKIKATMQRNEDLLVAQTKKVGECQIGLQKQLQKIRVEIERVNGMLSVLIA